MGDVRVPVGSGDLPAFVSIREQPAPWPGVVVLHDIAGMTEDLRNQTRWLARGGFLAAAPNLLFRGGKMKCLFAIARDLKAPRGPTYDDVEAVRTWLVSGSGALVSQQSGHLVVQRAASDSHWVSRTVGGRCTEKDHQLFP
jgi:carboxymethylenebutenolidase